MRFALKLFFVCVTNCGTARPVVQGADGIVVCRTEHHFVIAFYRQGMFASVCVEATETLGLYKKKNLGLR